MSVKLEMTETPLTAEQKEKALKEAYEVITEMAQVFPQDKALAFTAAAQAYVAALSDRQLMEFKERKPPVSPAQAAHHAEKSLGENGLILPFGPKKK